MCRACMQFHNTLEVANIAVTLKTGLTVVQHAERLEGVFSHAEHTFECPTGQEHVAFPNRTLLSITTNPKPSRHHKP